MIPFDTRELKGGAFACLAGCGFCCATSPFVRDDEAATLAGSRAGRFVVRGDDGALALRLATAPGGGTGGACVGLRDDRACDFHDARPHACRAYPFHIHAGRRVQVTTHLACPGLWEHARAATATDATTELVPAGEAIASAALAAPGAKEHVLAAKATFHEFDRRLREIDDAPDERACARGLRDALPFLMEPEALTGFFTGLAPGTLAAPDAGELHFTEPDGEPLDLFSALAADAFPGEAPRFASHVSADLEWSSLVYRPRGASGALATVRHALDGTAADDGKPVSVADALMPWDDEARAEGAAYLALLTRRDVTGGTAAHVMDAAGYRVTFAAAYARVVADAAAQLVLRAGVNAKRARRRAVGVADARAAVRATDASVLAWPTVGVVL